MSYIRYPAVAGMFYPAEADVLRQQVQAHLAAASLRPSAQALKALVAPHAGYIYSGPVAGSAYRQLDALDKNKHWKVFLLGPCHRVPLRGASVCAFDQYQTPLGSIPVSPVAKTLAQQLGFVPEADLQEHALEVQLPFLQLQLPSFELIPIVIGQAAPAALAAVLSPLLDEDSLLVISTDLSHYLTYEEARKVDAIANQAIPALDIVRMQRQGDACGIVGVLSLMHLAQARGWQGQLLDYRNSGDTAGPRDRVVGYGAYAFTAAAA